MFKNVRRFDLLSFVLNFKTSNIIGNQARPVFEPISGQ